MTRDEKILSFLKEDHGSHFPKWCDAQVCGCTGCVNKSGGARAWAEKHPDEARITREEFERLKS